MSRGGSEGVWRVSLRCLKTDLRVSGDTVKGVWSQDRSSKVRPSQVKSGQLRSAQVRSGGVKSELAKSKTGPFRTGEVRTVQVRTGQVKTGLIWPTQFGSRVWHSQLSLYIYTIIPYA